MFLPHLAPLCTSPCVLVYCTPRHPIKSPIHSARTHMHAHVHTHCPAARYCAAFQHSQCVCDEGGDGRDTLG